MYNTTIGLDKFYTADLNAVMIDSYNEADELIKLKKLIYSRKNAINLSDSLMQKFIDSDKLKISGIKFEDYIIRRLDIIKDKRYHSYDFDKNSNIQFYTGILRRIQDKSKI